MNIKSLTETKVTRLPGCDMDNCTTEAEFDAKTKMGPWAYLCAEHMVTHGIGLGTGVGQRLIVEKPARIPKRKADTAFEPHTLSLLTGGVMERSGAYSDRPCHCEDYPCCGH